MGIFTNAAKNTALDALTLTYAAVFDGEPGNGGTELDEQAITFGAASNGERAASTDPEFDIPSNSKVNWVVIRAGSGGTEQLRDEVDEEAFTNAGTYTLTSFVATLSDPTP